MATAHNHILFIHGGGDDGHEADKPLAAALRKELGPAYRVRYPKMPADPAPDFGWGARIASEIDAIDGKLFLAGHSLGASMLLKYVSEHELARPVAGIFLMATPFWRGGEDWEKGLMLRDSFAETLPRGVPLYLYHAEDDDEVPVSHLSIYAARLPRAIVRTFASGGHQLEDHLADVARDIRRVAE